MTDPIHRDLARAELEDMSNPKALNAYLDRIEATRITDHNGKVVYRPPNRDEAKLVVNWLVEEIVRYLEHDVPFFSSVTVLMSGGADSTLLACLLQRAAGELFSKTGRRVRIIGITIPCALEDSAKHYTDLGTLAARLYCDEVANINIGDLHAQVMDRLYRPDHFTFESGKTLVDLQTEMGIDPLRYGDETQKSYRLSRGNVAARLRMIIGYGLGGILGGAQVSTDNLTEGLMGFWTLCGDEGTFKLAQGLLKGLEIPQVMHALDIPDIYIVQKPTDGLGVGDGDVAQLYGDLYTGKETYADVDEVIIRMFLGDDFPDKLNPTVNRIAHPIYRQYINTEFKRSPFSLGRYDIGLTPLRGVQFAK